MQDPGAIHKQIQNTKHYGKPQIVWEKNPSDKSEDSSQQVLRKDNA